MTKTAELVHHSKASDAGAAAAAAAAPAVAAAVAPAAAADSGAAADFEETTLSLPVRIVKVAAHDGKPESHRAELLLNR